MCVCICVCFAFQAANAEHCLMQLHFKWLCPPGHHVEARVSHEIFSRGKLQHNFFIKERESSCMEHQRRRHYIILQSIRGRHEPHQPIACIWWHHYESQNQISSTLCSVIQQHSLSSFKRERNELEYDSKQCGSAQLGRYLKGSWGSLQWLVLNKSVLDTSSSISVPCTAEKMYWLDDCVVTKSEGNTSGSNHCTVGGRAELIHTHTQTNTHSAVIGQWSVKSNITWPSAVIRACFPLQWHWWMCERLKSTWWWGGWQLVIHSFVVVPRKKQVV